MNFNPTHNPAQVDARLLEHIRALVDDASTTDLNQLLRESSAARAAYLDYLELHALLAWEYGEIRSVQDKPTPSSPMASRFRGRAVGVRGLRIADWRLRIGTAIAAAIALVATVWLFFQPETRNPKPETATPQSYTVATLTNTTDARFVSDPPQLGDALAAGPIQLTSGNAQIMFASNAVADLTGPCEFEMTGPNRGRLVSGRLEAYVPQRAHGFTIDLPGGAKVVDLGTRFDVSIGPDKRSIVHVAEGRVECFDAADHAIRLDPARFVIYNARGRLQHELAIPAEFDLAADYIRDDAASPPVGIGPPLAPIDAGGFATAAPVIEQTDDWIIEASVTAESEQAVGIVAYNGDSGPNGFGIIQHQGRWKLLFGNVGMVDFGAPVEPGRRVDLAAARSAGTLHLYVDGRPVAAPGTPAIRGPNPPRGAFMIGGHPNYPDQTFGGLIHRVRAARLTGPLDPQHLIHDHQLETKPTPTAPLSEPADHSAATPATDVPSREN